MRSEVVAKKPCSTRTTATETALAQPRRNTRKSRRSPRGLKISTRNSATTTKLPCQSIWFARNWVPSGSAYAKSDDRRKRSWSTAVHIMKKRVGASGLHMSP